jgi:thioredoxin-related protein
MRALSREAQTLGVPILIEFALVHCEFCKRLEADYLAPMADSSEYKTKVLIRQVIIDEDRTLRDFNGEMLAVEQFSARYHADVTPTLVLLDYDGQQIGKKLVGYTETGFYGGKLDDLIEGGLTQVRR